MNDDNDQINIFLWSFGRTRTITRNGSNKYEKSKFISKQNIFTSLDKHHSSHTHTCKHIHTYIYIWTEKTVVDHLNLQKMSPRVNIHIMYIFTSQDKHDTHTHILMD